MNRMRESACKPCMSDRGLMSRKHKEPKKFNNKINNPIKKWEKDMDTFFHNNIIGQ